MKSKILVAVFFSCFFLSSLGFALNTAFVPPVDSRFIGEAPANFGAVYPAYPVKEAWHCGWDIVCPVGTAVISPSDGIVVKCSPTGWDLKDLGPNCQNYAMCIRYLNTTGERSIWIFGHLERPKDVNGVAMSDEQIRIFRIGDIVQAGEIIGLIGRYGRSAHLHLGIYCNLQDSQEFPTEGLGRQPLPRPDASNYHGVLRYGNWFDPLGWMQTFDPINISEHGIGYQCLLPTAASDSQHFFYIREDNAGQTLMMADTEGKDSVGIWRIPERYQAVEIFAGPDGSVFVKTQFCFGNDQYLYSISPGKEAKLLLLGSGDFGIGHWRADANYLPIRMRMVWEAFDLENVTVKPREEVMGSKIEGALGALFGEQIWRLLGSDIDFTSSKERLVCWCVSATEEYKHWIDTTLSGEEFSGLVVLESHLPEDPPDTERVVFAARCNTAPIHNLFLGRLVPRDDDPLHKGYRIEDVRQLTTGPDDKISHSVLQVDGKEVILAQMRVEGKWQIFSLDTDGRNLTQLTGLPGLR